LLFCAADKKNQEIQDIKDGMIIKKRSKDETAEWKSPL